MWRTGIVVVLAVAACSVAPERACTPGAVVSCACAFGVGTQECVADGSRLGPCACPDAWVNDGDASASRVDDAGLDAGPSTDAFEATGDASVDDCAIIPQAGCGSTRTCRFSLIYRDCGGSCFMSRADPGSPMCSAQGIRGEGMTCARTIDYDRCELTGEEDWTRCPTGDDCQPGMFCGGPICRRYCLLDEPDSCPPPPTWPDGPRQRCVNTILGDNPWRIGHCTP